MLCKLYEHLSNRLKSHKSQGDTSIALNKTFLFLQILNFYFYYLLKCSKRKFKLKKQKILKKKYLNTWYD